MELKAHKIRQIDVISIETFSRPVRKVMISEELSESLESEEDEDQEGKSQALYIMIFARADVR